MKEKNTRMGGVNSSQNITSLFQILLFFLFTLCIVLVMAIGANVYKNIARRMENNFTERTGIMFIINKVRQYDYDGYVKVSRMEERSVLELKEIETELDYHTLIYSYDGKLRELFKAVEDDIPLSEGIEIVDADEVLFTMEKDNLLSIKLKGTEIEQETHVKLRSGGVYE